MALNAQVVPFVFNQTMEWTNVPDSSKTVLLGYANAGAYNSPVRVDSDSIQESILITGIKSRSGKVEDQIWIKLHEGGSIVNYLFAKNELPEMELDPTTAKLAISAHRGDSKTSNGVLLSRGPYAL